MLISESEWAMVSFPFRGNYGSSSKTTFFCIDEAKRAAGNNFYYRCRADRGRVMGPTLRAQWSFAKMKQQEGAFLCVLLQLHFSRVFIARRLAPGLFCREGWSAHARTQEAWSPTGRRHSTAILSGLLWRWHTGSDISAAWYGICETIPSRFTSSLPPAGNIAHQNWNRARAFIVDGKVEVIVNGRMIVSGAGTRVMPHSGF